MAVTFYLAKNYKECRNNPYLVHFDEELHDKIWKDRDQITEKAQVLYNLDPYDVKCLSYAEIKAIKEACLELKPIYSNEHDFAEFFSALINLCNLALKQQKSLMAVGD